MFRVLGLLALAGLVGWAAAPPAESACCYFAAKDKDVLQPAQKAFLTWDPKEEVETFTVQPRFEGNAQDFGMVIPTPSRPRLDEMPRDFFKALAVFTILEPMDLSKYKQPNQPMSLDLFAGDASATADKKTVKVLEAGVVGSLDYKIISSERADDLYEWLKENKYNFSGDEATLDFYVRKKWLFSVMKIDPMQMKRRPDGSYLGEVTPTRFTFASPRPVYPLKITQISVKDRTEALFYVQAPDKLDLAGGFSYEPTWTPMWAQAMSFAIPEKLTKEEAAWKKHVEPLLKELLQATRKGRPQQGEPTTLEWAKRIKDADIAVLEDKKAYNRDAPKEDVDRLKLLKGHVRKGQFVTKLRKVFAKDEMDDDLEFVRARVGDKDDDIEYFSILPTSPP